MVRAVNTTDTTTATLMTCANCAGRQNVKMTCFASRRTGIDGGPLGNMCEPRCTECRRASDPLGAALGWYG